MEWALSIAGDGRVERTILNALLSFVLSRCHVSSIESNIRKLGNGVTTKLREIYSDSDTPLLATADLRVTTVPCPGNEEM
jgi:hypothetical protein